MIREQNSPQLAKLGRRILERREQERAFVEGERDQLEAVGEGALEPVG